MVDKHSAAVEALEAFWGRSNGGNEAYAQLHETLRSLKLGPSELRSLQRNLPVTETGVGTTHARIQRAARCLEDLAET